MLVPGLAFTKQGHRLGRGKGYYDAYLERCKMSNTQSLTTIGLAFTEQMVDYIPTHEHDVSVDNVFHAEVDWKQCNKYATQGSLLLCFVSYNVRRRLPVQIIK